MIGSSPGSKADFYHVVFFSALSSSLLMAVNNIISVSKTGQRSTAIPSSYGVCGLELKPSNASSSAVLDGKLPTTDEPMHRDAKWQYSIQDNIFCSARIGADIGGWPLIGC